MSLIIGFKLILQNKLKSYFSIIFILISTILEGIGVVMLMPLMLGSLDSSESKAIQIIRYVFESCNVEVTNFNLILSIVAIFLLKSGSHFFSEILSLNIRLEFHQKTKEYLYEKYFLSSDKNGLKSSEYLNIHSEELNKATMFIYYFFLFLAHSSITIVYIGLVFLNDLSFGIISLGQGILLILVFKNISSKIAQSAGNLTTSNQNLNSILVPFIASREYMALTRKEGYFAQKYNAGLIENIQTRRSTDTWIIIGSVIREPLSLIALAVAAVLEIRFFDTSLGTIGFSIVLFYRSLSMGLMAQGWHQRLSENLASLKAILKITTDTEDRRTLADLFDASNTNVSSPRLKCLKIEGGTVYRSSWFRLAVDSMILNVGDIIEVSGPSGSGKSTLMKALVGAKIDSSIKLCYVGKTGSIIDQSRIRIGFVTQDVSLFPGTLLDNILLDEPYDSTRIHSVIDRVGLNEYVESTEHGLNFPLSEDTIELSGGQKQRILLARELYRKVDLLVLDEATSAVDGRTEEYIYRAISASSSDIIVFILSHGNHHKKICNKRITLENGKVHLDEK